MPKKKTGPEGPVLVPQQYLSESAQQTEHRLRQLIGLGQN